MERAVMQADLGDSLLVRQFREFYHEIIDLKEFARSSAAVPAATDSLAGMERPAATEIRERLMTLLDRQQHLAQQFGGDFMLSYEQARYIMVALADEIFLHSNWPGRFDWNFNLLETRLYQTRIAGEVFFQRVDLLLVSPRDAMKMELAKTYLMALSLGFQGRYRGADPYGDLARYRRRLYQHIYEGNHRLRDDPKPLFPETTEHTVNTGELRLLPPLRTWVIRLAVVVVLALGVQHVLWHYSITPHLWTLIDQILYGGAR